MSETCNHSFVTPDGGSWKAVALGECPWCEIERFEAARAAVLERIRAVSDPPTESESRLQSYYAFALTDFSGLHTVAGNTHRVYLASDVDAALAEKDRRIAELEDSIKAMALRIASPAREV